MNNREKELFARGFDGIVHHAVQVRLKSLSLLDKLQRSEMPDDRVGEIEQHLFIMKSVIKEVAGMIKEIQDDHSKNST